MAVSLHCLLWMPVDEAPEKKAYRRLLATPSDDLFDITNSPWRPMYERASAATILADRRRARARERQSYFDRRSTTL